jgi:hypothetical protein
MNSRRPPQRKQLGVQIDAELWTQLKILALKHGVPAFEALEAAIREYLQNHGKEGQ